MVKYILRHGDNELIRFSLSRKGDHVENVEPKKENRMFFVPSWGGGADPEKLETWLRERALPGYRYHADEILQGFGIWDSAHYLATLSAGNGVSLVDKYSIVPEDRSYRFASSRLWSRDWEHVAPRLGLGLESDTDMMDPSYASPELTTGGRLPKGWFRGAEDDWPYLYKTGRVNMDGSRGPEAWNEVYVQQVGDVLELDIVRYVMEELEGLACSVCRCFTDPRSSFFSIKNCRPGRSEADELAFYQDNGYEYQYRAMRVFDYLVYNTDRHARDHGFLYSNATGQLEKMAPLFDNGSSLLYDQDGDLADMDWSTLEGVGGIAEEVRTHLDADEKLRDKVKQLSDFTFTYLQDGPARERMENLGAGVRWRAAQLLK